MDLKQIEYFVRVAELGSFTRASDLLSIAQPALSRQVRALEIELRQALLARNGRGVTLTDAGRRLLEHGRGILAQVERARLDIEHGRGSPAGRLTIALPPSVGRTLTGPLVRGFRERFPRATLSVMESLSTYALEWLAIGRVDCAVIYNAAPSPAIDLAPVLNEQLFLVSGRARTGQRGLIGPTASLAEVARHALAIPSRPHAIRMLLESALAKAGHVPTVALEVESIPVILDLVQHDDVHAVLSLNAIRSTGSERSFHARPIGPPSLSTTLWIAISAQRPGGPLLEQAVALVRELLLQQWGKAASLVAPS